VVEGVLHIANVSISRVVRVCVVRGSWGGAGPTYGGHATAVGREDVASGMARGQGGLLLPLGEEREGGHGRWEVTREESQADAETPREARHNEGPSQ